jgi:L-histidine N-alpha-methyltransferase
LGDHPHPKTNIVIKESVLSAMPQQTTPIADRLKIDVYLDEKGMLDSMPEEVRAGLSASPKRLAPKYFYDEAGSILFEKITELPEYYPTRAEGDLLQKISADLMSSLRPQQIVELGSGSSYKTRQLLRSATAPEYLETYVPFDVSESIVREAADQLVVEYPYLTVHGVIGDFSKDLGYIPAATGPRLVLFLGGTIGNMDPEERVSFLRQVSGLLGPADRLLIGMDLVKDVSIIEAAYNDDAGVTAAFNRNMLHFLNRTLDADFHPEAFEHRCFFNEAESRIEMHLVPRSPQIVTITGLGMTVTFTPEDSLWTECSYKFTEGNLKPMLADAGLSLEHFYTNEDPERLFGLALVGLLD